MLKFTDGAVVVVGETMILAACVPYFIIKSFDLKPTFPIRMWNLVPHCKLCAHWDWLMSNSIIKNNYTFLPCRINIHGLKVCDLELLRSGRDLSGSTLYFPFLSSSSTSAPSHAAQSPYSFDNPYTDPKALESHESYRPSHSKWQKTAALGNTMLPTRLRTKSDPFLRLIAEIARQRPLFLFSEKEIGSMLAQAQTSDIVVT